MKGHILEIQMTSLRKSKIWKIYLAILVKADVEGFIPQYSSWIGFKHY